MAVTSAAQVAAKMTQCGEAVGKVQANAVRLASATIKESVTAVAPARLRNAGKHGAALGVSVKSTTGPNATSTGKATGPWPLIEYPTPTHLIGIGRAMTGTRITKARKRAKVTVSNGAAIGGILHGARYEHPVRGPVVHPGTKGKLLFHKGVAIGTPRAVAVVRKATIDAVKAVF